MKAKPNSSFKIQAKINQMTCKYLTLREISMPRFFEENWVQIKVNEPEGKKWNTGISVAAGEACKAIF